MNFIKIIVTADVMNVRLFVKEKDCYQVLRCIHDAHLALPYSDPNKLCVNMRRVRIEDARARKNTFTGNRLAQLCENSMSALNRLKLAYKQVA